MPKVELSFRQIVEAVEGLPEKQALQLRKLLEEKTKRPKPAWGKRLKTLFAEVKERARAYPEEEIDRDIERAIKEVCSARG
jgi:hypothetical protein